MPPRRLALVLALLFSTLPSAACRLPAREWRWEVSGAEPTWLASLGEASGCGIVLRLWAAPRSMWPLPLPASRPMLYGGENLQLLALVENTGPGRVSFHPERARLRPAPAERDTAPAALTPGCGAVAAAGEKTACGFTVAIPRGTDAFDLDLTESVPCADPGFVFRLSRSAAWRWRRVGPGVPGL